MLPRFKELLRLLRIGAMMLGVMLATSCQDSTEDDFAWMIAYSESNAAHTLLPRADAERMAKACLYYDTNPKRRFVELVGYNKMYGGFVAEAFHSYNPDTHVFRDAEALGKLSILAAKQGDVSTSNFFERLSRQGRNAY